MAFINFPDNPNIGDTFFVGIYKYIWTGDAWDREIVNVAELTTGIKSEIVGSAPEDLDTLDELAAALADDADFSVAVLAGLADIPDKLSKSTGGTVSGPMVFQNSVGDPSVEIPGDRVNVKKTMFLTGDLNVIGPMTDDYVLSASEGGGVVVTKDFTVSDPSFNEIFKVNRSAGEAFYNGSPIATGAELDLKANKSLGIIGRTSHTLNLDDAGNVLTVDSTGTSTITIPTDTTAFPTGTEVAIVRMNTGAVNITPASGVTLNSVDNKRSIKGRYGSAVCLKIASNNWVLIGSLE